MRLAGKLRDWLLFAFLMSLTIAVYAEVGVPLIEPGPIAFPNDRTYTPNQVKEAIIDGVARYKWHVENEAPGAIRIKLESPREGIVLVMDVLYDATSYSLKYVSSQGLGYQSADEKTGAAIAKNPNSNTVSRNDEISGTTIDSRYVRWMRKLQKGINRELKLSRR